MAEDQRPEEVQRWTARRHAALVVSLIKGETTAVVAARQHGLKVARLKRKVGELAMDLDILREAARRPLTPGTSDE